MKQRNNVQIQRLFTNDNYLQLCISNSPKRSMATISARFYRRTFQAMKQRNNVQIQRLFTNDVAREQRSNAVPTTFGYESLWNSRVPEDLMVRFWRMSFQSKSPEIMDTDESWIEQEDQHDLFLEAIDEAPLSAEDPLSDADGLNSIGSVGSNFQWQSV